MSYLFAAFFPPVFLTAFVAKVSENLVYEYMNMIQQNH